MMLFNSMGEVAVAATRKEETNSETYDDFSGEFPATGGTLATELLPADAPAAAAFAAPLLGAALWDALGSGGTFALSTT